VSIPPGRARRLAWLTPPVVASAWLSVASGMAQFTVTAVIGDVAAAFGTTGDDASLTGRIGVSATTVGIALALIRLASLASLPTAALADRSGRRSTLLTLSAIGLALTAASALAPGFWWYVALVALARPAMSAVNAIAGVVASEETRTADRSAAIALITAAYGVGAGIVSVGRSLLPGEPSFRLVSAASMVPLVLLPVLARRLREPELAQRAGVERGLPGRVPAEHRRVTTVLAFVTGAIALATGPAFTYLFVYGERVLGASPATLSLLVVAAGPAGLVGILVGRAGSDRIGRGPTAGVSMAATGAAVALAYSGGRTALAVGYLAAITTSSAFAPPAGALAAELVPTRIRATIAGWMTVAGVLGAVIGLTGFGVLADATGGFDRAAIALGALTALAALGFRLLPDTRGSELEELDGHDVGDIGDVEDDAPGPG